MIDGKNTDALAIWRELAHVIIVNLALTTPEFTSDDVWKRLDRVPSHPERRVLGAVFIAAKDAGVIREAERYKKSERRVNHGRPIPIWQSRIYREPSVAVTPDLPDNVLPFERTSRQVALELSS